MKILVVEDDDQVRDFIVKGFKEQSHQVVGISDGQEALYEAISGDWDMLIIDRLLPKLDGLSILKSLRANQKTVPVIVLSALGEVDHRVEGLRAGGDDYLVKPFAFEELLARVEVLHSRYVGHQETAADQQLECGDLVLNLLNCQVTRLGQPVLLQHREFKLLAYLMQNQNQVVTRTMLLENVWDYHFDPQTNVIDVHISRLRQKLNKGFDEDIIETVRGFGYRIKV